MKASPQDVLRQAGTVRAVLLYGPDEGLVSETSSSLLKLKGVQSSQAMGYVGLSGKAIKDDPSLLFDELNAWGLLQEERVVCIHDASDGLTTTLRTILDAAQGSSVLTVLIAGELGPSSSLRKLFESSSQALSVACYALSGGDLAAHIRKVSHGCSKVLEEEALRYCVATLGNDSAVATREIEKLCLYVGKRSTITYDDVQVALCENGQFAVDDMIVTVFEKKKVQTLSHLDHLFENAIEPIIIIRSLLRYVRRMREVHLYKVHEGLSFQQGIAKLSPPVFWKYKDAFLKAVHQTPYSVLERLEEELQQLEYNCKQSGSLPQLLTKQSILSFS